MRFNAEPSPEKVVRRRKRQSTCHSTAARITSLRSNTVLFADAQPGEPKAKRGGVRVVAHSCSVRALCILSACLIVARPLFEETADSVISEFLNSLQRLPSDEELQDLLMRLQQHNKKIQMVFEMLRFLSLLFSNRLLETHQQASQRLPHGAIQTIAAKKNADANQRSNRLASFSLKCFKYVIK